MAKQKLGDPTDFSYRVKKVTKVVDGDTIDVTLDMGFDILYQQRVRLFGIDTPESRTRDKVEKVYGLKSKKFLQEQIKKAKKVSIKTYKGDETGKFGRILGELWRSSSYADKSLNDYLVEKHHAGPYLGQSKEDVAEQHLLNRSKLNL